MKAQDLKNSILQLAIQGKLVPQNPNDESAEVLYEKIQSEKQKLIKEGKIKKDKPLLPITDDEIPFPIPSTWKWVRLGDCLDVRDGTHDTPKYVSVGIPLVTSKNLYNGFLDLSNVKYISTKDAEKINERSKVHKNDILFAMIGTIGNPVIVNIIPNFCIKNVALIKNNDFVDIKYVAHFLAHIQNDMKKQAQGAVQSFVSLSFIRNFPIPLPPLVEQKRIVAKIEELDPLVKRYDKAETELSNLNESFPEQLKKSILQYAIQGKLVPQDPNDEPADVLYEKIQSEKRRLIKEGKIKKDKPLPPITDDEIPFKIPQSWKWVRLGNIAVINGGFAFKSTQYKDTGIRVIRISDFDESGFKNNKIVRYDYNDDLKPYIIEQSNILMAMTGGTVGKSYFIMDLPEPMVSNQRVATIKINEKICPNYINIVILAPVIQKLIQISKNSTNDNISMDLINNFIVPLPPLAEQKRIVAKVDELIRYCEKLIRIKNN